MVSRLVCDYPARQWTSDLAEALPAYRRGSDALEVEDHSDCVKLVRPTTKTQGNLLYQVEVDAVHVPWAISSSGLFKMAIEHAHGGYRSHRVNMRHHDSLAFLMVR